MSIEIFLKNSIFSTIKNNSNSIITIYYYITKYTEVRENVPSWFLKETQNDSRYSTFGVYITSNISHVSNIELIMSKNVDPNMKIINIDDGGVSSDESSDTEESVSIVNEASGGSDSESELSLKSDSEPNSPIKSATSETVVGGKSKKEESDDSSDDDSSDEECSTTELLAADPLYFVLSRFFITDDGKSIVKVLDEINHKLGKIAKALKHSD